MKKLYPYQQEAFDSTEKSNIGRILMPTGTGKTLIASEILAQDILKNPGYRLYTVCAPRILLTYQLMTEVYKNLLNHNINVINIFVHTGGKMDEETKQEFYTLRDRLKEEKNFRARICVDRHAHSQEDLEEILEDAQIKDIPVICFATYHSFPLLQSFHKNLEIHDEAQYLTQIRFHFDLLNSTADRRYFFTATQLIADQTSGDGAYRGMDNIDIYGEDKRVQGRKIQEP
jgi:CRISPR/Cas system-associated endonuclease/helicase Cas3